MIRSKKKKRFGRSMNQEARLKALHSWQTAVLDGRAPKGSCRGDVRRLLAKAAA